MDEFDGENGFNDLKCPACKETGQLHKHGYLFCPYDDCRVSRFFTQ